METRAIRKVAALVLLGTSLASVPAAQRLAPVRGDRPEATDGGSLVRAQRQLEIRLNDQSGPVGGLLQPSLAIDAGRLRLAGGAPGNLGAIVIGWLGDRDRVVPLQVHMDHFDLAGRLDVPLPKAVGRQAYAQGLAWFAGDLRPVTEPVRLLVRDVRLPVPGFFVDRVRDYTVPTSNPSVSVSLGPRPAGTLGQPLNRLGSTTQTEILDDLGYDRSGRGKTKNVTTVPQDGEVPPDLASDGN